MASIFLSSATIASISCNSCTYIWRWIFETLWNICCSTFRLSNFRTCSALPGLICIAFDWVGSWHLVNCVALPSKLFQHIPCLFQSSTLDQPPEQLLIIWGTFNQHDQITTLGAAGSPGRLRAEVEPNKENNRWNARQTEVVLPPIVDLPQTRCLYILCLFSTTSPKAASTIAAMTWPKQIITWNWLMSRTRWKPDLERGSQESPQLDRAGLCHVDGDAHTGHADAHPHHNPTHK